MDKLTPYDTGERAEPVPWVQRAMDSWSTGTDLRAPQPDDFGKVDFDDDGGITVATVWLERNERSGQYVVHIQKRAQLGLRIHQEE